MRNIYFFLFALFFAVTFTSCDKRPDIVELGLKPIYADPLDFTLIRSEEPRGFVELGNIVNVGDYVFIGERNQGIHVIDNSNPSNPVKILFWSIPGNNEFTIEGDILYADNSFYLLVIDISDFGDIQYIKHIDGVYQPEENFVRRPQESYNGYFECTDPSKGIIVGWEMVLLTNPKCETF